MDNFVIRKNPTPKSTKPPLNIYTDGACSNNGKKNHGCFLSAPPPLPIISSLRIMLNHSYCEKLASFLCKILQICCKYPGISLPRGAGGYTVGLLRGKRSKSEPDLDLDLDQVGGVYSWFIKGKSRPQADFF